MTKKDNPYASPRPTSLNHPNEKEVGCPHLPFTIRPSVGEVAFATIFGVMLAIGSVFAIRAAMNMLTFTITSPLGIAALAIAVASFAGSIMFLSSNRSKLVADTIRLQVRGTTTRSIHYGDIESWHRHPATGAVLVLVKGQAKSIAVPSWPISAEESQMLCEVLRHYVN